MNEDETSEAMGEIEASKIVYANVNENGDGNEHEGWLESDGIRTGMVLAPYF
jgi:hypothetical protein